MDLINASRGGAMKNMQRGQQPPSYGQRGTLYLLLPEKIGLAGQVVSSELSVRFPRLNDNSFRLEAIGIYEYRRSNLPKCKTSF